MINKNFKKTDELENKIILKYYDKGNYYFVVYTKDKEKEYKVSLEEFNSYEVMDEYIKPKKQEFKILSHYYSNGDYYYLVKDQNNKKILL